MSARTMISLLIAAATTACGQPGLQRQDQMAWAIADAGSTAPAIVRVRLLRSYNDVGTVTCLTGEGLVYAILTEFGDGRDAEDYERAEAYVLSSRDHVFRLTRPKAWEFVERTRRPEDDAEMAKACRLIEQGKSAFIGDMAPYAHEGPKFPLSTASAGRQ